MNGRCFPRDLPAQSRLVRMNARDFDLENPVFSHVCILRGVSLRSVPRSW
jgi:hypothetical protein